MSREPDHHELLDTFAGIAGRNPAQIDEDLVVPTPAPPVARVWPSRHDPDAAFELSIDEDDAPGYFDRALQAERQRWQPFLRNLAPQPYSSRIVLPITTAAWRLEPDSDWHSVGLPHYGGPQGRARAWYRMHFETPEAMRSADCMLACFRAVDYRAAVFCNGDLVGTHEGFFAPFQFEITPSLRAGRNELLVRVDNDAICMGNSPWDRGDLEGDKLYAATGPGWDEPGTGWHHCPPGMGILRPITVEARPSVYLHECWVRTLSTDGDIEIHAEIFNTTSVRQPVTLSYALHGRNIETPPLPAGEFGTLAPAGPGLNFYRIRTRIENPALWSTDSPSLYQVTIYCGEDSIASTFGVRIFRQDALAEPRGRFFLNDHAIRLRGANTMGHEQQCVLRGDHRQLLDDLLIAKMSRLNFMRFTQRPVEPEVYELCDQLGLLAQTDLPLFAYLRRNQFAEAIRQTIEMERIVRGHACAVVVSFINEPFPESWGDKTHRHLNRAQLEAFLRAAAEAVHVENPDRVIKPIDGDYQPPGPGLPDNHAYPGWYNGHAIELGRLHRGYWVGVKRGWLHACGEYGAEGLDPVDLMRRRYPADWMPDGRGDESTWTPQRIHKCQTGQFYAMFFDRRHTLDEWVAASHSHQAWVIDLMTRAFRRDPRMVSFAVHLLIDAFPAGWLKSLIDCERRPKPAWSAFRKALAPMLVDLRLDRWHWWSGEYLGAEAWICNDTLEVPPGMRLHHQLEVKGQVVFAHSNDPLIEPDMPVSQGVIRVRLPEVRERTPARLHLGLFDKCRRCIDAHSVPIEIFPRPLRAKTPPGVFIPGDATHGPAARLARELELPPTPDSGIMLIDDPAIWRNHADEFLAAVAGGATAILLEMGAGTLELPGGPVVFEVADMSPRIFVSRATGHTLVAGFAEHDFRFWYSPDDDRPGAVLETLFTVPPDRGWQPVLTTVQGGWSGGWRDALAAALLPHGAGRIVICQVRLADRIPANPVAREFAERVVGLHCAVDTTQATAQQDRP